MPHTPGNWTVQGLIVKDGERLIADCRIAAQEKISSICKHSGNIGERDHESVVRLIAAAPDLLEACKSLQRYIHSNFCKEHPSHEISASHRAECDVLRAAIFKAEGR